MCPHTTMYGSYISVLIVLYMCFHTAIEGAYAECVASIRALPDVCGTDEVCMRYRGRVC
jgi:hypothetical protein